MTANEPGLPVKVSAIAHAFAEGDVPYAFGGALALAYYAEPRATVDVDVNVFVPPDDFERIMAAIEPVGVAVTATDRRNAPLDGQVRLWWGNTPVDLFFAYDDFHYNAARRVRTVPFGADTIRILAAEDLLVCKAVFDRRKDWIDIEQMLLLTAGSFDVTDARRWVVRIVGADDPRVARLDQAIDDVLGAGGGTTR